MLVRKMLLTSLRRVFWWGHSLLGVLDLLKLLVTTVSKALGLEFSRIQFTPDLMPTDITGTEVLNKDRVLNSVMVLYLQT